LYRGGTRGGGRGRVEDVEVWKEEDVVEPENRDVFKWYGLVSTNVCRILSRISLSVKRLLRVLIITLHDSKDEIF
jgi:hypothetical protein